MPKLPPATKLSSIKPGAIQLWAPLALEMAIRGEDPPLTPGQRKVLSERKNLLHLSTTAGSWNHQQMLWALGLWLDDDIEGKEYTADWWVGYLRAQLGDYGDNPVHLGLGGYLSQWGGSESNSAGYEHMRWGAVCAVDLWARKLKLANGQHNTLATLCRRYHQTQVAMCCLLPTAVGERSGEHSKPLLHEMWKLAEVRQDKHRWGREIDWPMRLAMKTPDFSYRSAVHAPQIARPLFSEIRCSIWANGAKAFWLLERKNRNTPTYLIDVQAPDGRTLIYPWQKGRAFNDKRGGHAMLLPRSRLAWVIFGGEDSETGYADLPPDPPSKCCAIGPSGYVEGDWAAWLRGE